MHLTLICANVLLVYLCNFVFVTDSIPEGFLVPEAKDTADFLLFMDSLFDSVNGSRPVPVEGKNFRCAATKTSPHQEFWPKALKVLDSMAFQCPKTKSRSVPPSIKNWISTIKGLRDLSSMLLADGFRFVALRNFNQDPLENFFGNIRCQGVRNVNPTCVGFISAFKSLIVSNFMSSHSVSSNCEEDETEGALDTLRDFVQAEVIPQDEEPNVQVVMAPRKKIVPQTTISVATSTYISGFVAKKLFARTKNCLVCKESLMTSKEMPQHEFIIARRYSPKALCLPHTNFASICDEISTVVLNKLPEVSFQPNVTRILNDMVGEIDFSFLTCSSHDVKSLTIKVIVKLLMHAWITNVNRVLKGKMSVSATCSDPIKQQAHRLHSKNPGLKKK